MHTKHKHSALAWIICALAALFYLYEFSLQVSPGVMTHELMRDMHLNAASLGMVASAYFYAYAPMQIPAGLLHDHLGPRKTLTAAILACAVGALTFSVSDSIPSACAGRLLMGAGSAFSFTGALMLIARWFPPTAFAVLSGIVQLMSSIGAIGGEVPLSASVRAWGWRNSMTGLAIAGFVLALVVWLIVRDAPPRSTPVPTGVRREKPQGLRAMLGNNDTWWVATYSFLIWAPVIAFAGLWGVPFLVSAYPFLTTESAAYYSALLWIGVGIGSPLCGWISEKFEHRTGILIACAAMGVVSALLVIYVSLPKLALCVSLFVLGLAGGGQSLAFCVVRDISHPKTLGTSIGINNMATVAGGALIQPLIGCLLYFSWKGLMVNHVPVYVLSNYRTSLLIIPLCYVLATLISLFCIRETHCKQLYPDFAHMEGVQPAHQK